MRILLITGIFPPHIGGPATFIDSLGAALAHQGHQVTVVCSSERATEPSDRQRPFRVRRASSTNRVLRAARLRAILAQEILRHRTILVNGLSSQTYQIARFVGRRYVLKIVGDRVWEYARVNGLTTASIDEFQQMRHDHPYLRSIALQQYCSAHHAQMIITPSKYLRQMIIGWGIPASRIVVIPNGIPLDEYRTFHPIRRTTPTLDVAFCGRLVNWKGVESLLLAIQGLPHLRVTIIGDGPDRALLTTLAEQLGLDGQVRFVGALAQQPLRTMLSQMHVLVLMSLYEGLSHTLIEAGALGLACVASACGGNPEVITHQDTGLLVPYGDVADLRATLQRLQADEQERYRLACRAHQNSTRFDFHTTVQYTMSTLINQSQPHNIQGITHP